MSFFRAIRSMVGGVGHWLQEASCSIGQKVAERFEDASDALAEKRFRARGRTSYPVSMHLPSQQIVDVTEYRVINGHRHAD